MEDGKGIGTKPTLTSLTSVSSTLLSLTLLQPPIPSCSSNMLSLFTLQALCMAIPSAQNALAPAPPPFTHAHRGFHGRLCHLLQEAFLDYLSKVACLATFYSFLLLILPDMFVCDLFPPLKCKLHEL